MQSEASGCGLGFKEKNVFSKSCLYLNARSPKNKFEYAACLL